MPAINVKKLKEKQAEIEQKRGSSGSNLFINKKDLETPHEVRILEPSLSMEEIYFVEVPIWWIGSQKLISHEFLNKECIVDKELEAVRKSGDIEYKRLLTAKKDGKYPMIKKDYEYYMPCLHLNLDDAGDDLSGVMTNGEYDVNKIRECIVDGRAKILAAPLTVQRSIQSIVTSRGGADMTDRVKGFNIQISRTGKGTSTKYTATRLEAMPMPKEFYENPFDVVQFVRSGILSEEYQQMVLDNYFDGAELPEDKDKYFMFPDDREAVKEYFKSLGDEEEEKEKPRSGRPKSSTQKEEQAPKETEEGDTEAPWTDDGSKAEVDDPPKRSGRPKSSAPESNSPKKAGRPKSESSTPGRRRSLLKDMEGVDDE